MIVTGELSRRNLLSLFAAVGAGVALGAVARAADGDPAPDAPPGDEPQVGDAPDGADGPKQKPEGALERLPEFTGPGPNPYWNSVGPYVLFPGKLPLIRLTDKPVQLETPRALLGTAITTNAAFFVRWHLPNLPGSVDLSTFRLSVEGSVDKPLQLSVADLASRKDVTTVVAACQCAGNSRSYFQPRVPGGQWGNGAVGCASWTGVPLKALLAEAHVSIGTAGFVQFQGLDTGNGPDGKPSHSYMKSIPLGESVLDRALVVFAMNGEPLHPLHGFPLRLVVPGWYSDYWVKTLASVRVEGKVDDNFWTATAYRVPNNPQATTTPQEVAGGKLETVPITAMLPRSFLISPDGDLKVPAGMPTILSGIAWSGAAVSKVEVSVDEGKTWQAAKLGPDLGPYAFRTWQLPWTPAKAGTYTIAVRATDATGATQTDDARWNAGGYLWNQIERQPVVVGQSGGAA